MPFGKLGNNIIRITRCTCSATNKSEADLAASEYTTKLSDKIFATSIIKKQRTENKQATNQQKYPAARFLVATADKLELFFSSAGITVHRQAILLLFVESGTRKLRKLVESRTKFLFDVKRF